MALFIWIRKPRLTWISPRSSCHGTRNMMTRSGSTMRSMISRAAVFGPALEHEIERLDDLLHGLVELF